MQCKYLFFVLLSPIFVYAQPNWQSGETIDDDLYIIEHFDQRTEHHLPDPYLGIGAKYNHSSGQSGSAIGFELGMPIGKQNHKHKTYQQGYQDGYEAGFQAALRQNRQQNTNKYHTDKLDNTANGRYLCKLTIGSRTFTARGDYRDSARRQVYQACEQYYSHNRCQKRRTRCQTSW